MAQAVYQDALQRGLREVHLLTGYLHVQEVAWSLMQEVALNPTPPAVP